MGNNNKVSLARFRIANLEQIIEDIQSALYGWNSFAQPIRIEEAYKITWVEFKKLLIKKYCPRTEEFATLCPTMVPDSEKMVEVFIGGLPRSIEGNVTASKPQTLDEAINIAQRLMDQWCWKTILGLREMVDKGFTHQSRLCDIVEDNRWKWPEEWVSKYDLLFFSRIPVPILKDIQDKALWVTNKGDMVQFSTNQVWKDTRNDGATQQLVPCTLEYYRYDCTLFESPLASLYWPLGGIGESI
ncbi:hypothetical protein Tco_0706676 [Tanacetum coccineum]|uniref:Uncharacterized protein n=1 Tax=Tanacetum coccineum TaxID=301880 RepID=A0ABQ4Y8Y0_9ASTR